MPVAYNQIEEIDRIFRKYLTPVLKRQLLVELKRTQAYEKNRSFADTIDRLLLVSGVPQTAG